MSLSVRPLPCTIAPALASPASRALAVLAGGLATLATMRGGTASIWSIAGDLMPGQDAAILGLSLASLLGVMAGVAARATMLPAYPIAGMALAGGLVGTILAPPPVAGMSPVVILLAAMHLIGQRGTQRAPDAANDNPARRREPADSWVPVAEAHDRIATSHPST